MEFQEAFDDSLIDYQVNIAPMWQMAKNIVQMGRTGSPCEEAKADVWLTSDSASYVHGSILDVEGGR